MWNSCRKYFVPDNPNLSIGMIVGDILSLIITPPVNIEGIGESYDSTKYSEL